MASFHRKYRLKQYHGRKSAWKLAPSAAARRSGNAVRSASGSATRRATRPFVALAAMRRRREERAVGLDERPIDTATPCRRGACRPRKMDARPRDMEPGSSPARVSPKPAREAVGRRSFPWRVTQNRTLSSSADVDDATGVEPRAGRPARGILLTSWAVVVVVRRETPTARAGASSRPVHGRCPRRAAGSGQAFAACG